MLVYGNTLSTDVTS